MSAGKYFISVRMLFYSLKEKELDLDLDLNLIQEKKRDVDFFLQ